MALQTHINDIMMKRYSKARTRIWPAHRPARRALSRRSALDVLARGWVCTSIRT